MALPTMLQLVNAVQRRLRETQTASINTNARSLLIRDFVNEAKREVEDAYDWRTLRTDLQLSLSNGNSVYSLTGTHDRCRFYEPNKILLDSTNKAYIYPVPHFAMSVLTKVVVAQNGPPTYFRSLGSDNSTGLLKIEVYPVPTAAATVYVPLVIPQDDLTTDGALLYTPKAPIIELAYNRVVQERGEDGGVSMSQQTNNYLTSLAQAILNDGGRSADEMTWRVD